MELKQLLVSIVLDSECDLYPNVTSDESCEYLCSVSAACWELLVLALRAPNRFRGMNYSEFVVNELRSFSFKIIIKV